MKRVSDLQLLVVVLAVPVGALLLLSAIDALFGQENTGETIAIGCAMILMLASTFPQLAGVRFAENGPRSLQNRLGFLGAFFAMLLVGQMPSADQSLGRAALGWLPLALVIALVGGRDVASHIKAQRRHPRGLRLLARGGLFALALMLLHVGTVALRKDATLVQGIWAWLVMSAFVFSFPNISLQKLGRISDVRRFVLFLVDVISVVALFYIFVFVQQFGAMTFEDEMPILIGAAVGAVIGFGFMALRQRFLARNPSET
jgi:hypothetical protein